MNTCSCVSNKHVWAGQGFSYLKEMLKCGPSLMDVDWGGRIEANYTSGCMLSDINWVLIIQVFSISWSKLTMVESLTIQVFSFTWSKLTMMESHTTSSTQAYGEDYYKENFSTSGLWEDHLKEIFSNLKNLCQ